MNVRSLVLMRTYSLEISLLHKSFIELDIFQQKLTVSLEKFQRKTHFKDEKCCDGL